MPRFYGDSMDTIISGSMTLDDAMRITNHSPNSENADYGSNHILDSEIDEYLSFSKEEMERIFEEENPIEH